MCLQDVAVWRATMSSYRVVDVGTSPVLLCGAAQNRLGIILGNADANDIFVSTDPNITANVGVIRRSTSGPTQIRAETFGEIVTYAWYAISTSAGNSIGVWETLFDDAAAARALEYLERMKAGKEFA